MYNSIVNLGFQDVISTKDGSVLYTEILLFDLADEDIKDIEKRYRKSKAIREIDLDIIREAFRFIARNNLRSRNFGINIFEKSIESEEFKVDTIKLINDIADEYKINKSRIFIELNEDTDLESRVVQKRMKEIKEYGFRIALDDWGRKHGSIFSIIDDIDKRYIDVVKVDIEILRAMRKGQKCNEHIINMITSVKLLCDSSGKRVIIEGVESHIDEDIVGQCEIEYVQGFKFCKKLTEEEWLARIKDKQERVV